MQTDLRSLISEAVEDLPNHGLHSEKIDRILGAVTAAERWEPIEYARKDTTRVIAASFGRYGFVQLAWWQPEFEAWITSCRQIVMAEGYTIDGQAIKLHSPNIVEPTHFIAFPPVPGSAS